MLLLRLLLLGIPYTDIVFQCFLEALYLLTQLLREVLMLFLHLIKSIFLFGESILICVGDIYL